MTQPKTRRFSECKILVGSVVFGLFLACSPASAGPENYDYFRNLTPEESATFQLSLEWGGPRALPLQTVLLHASGEPMDASAFGTCQQRDVDPASIPPVRSVEVSAAEIGALISDLGSLPSVTAGDIEQRGMAVSFVVRMPSARCFETVVNHEGLRPLFDQLRLALAGNSAAYSQIQKLACNLEVSESQRPEDVTSLVTVKFSGLRREAASSDNFVGTAEITNAGLNSIPGPISLVLLRLPREVELLNQSDTTCETVRGGHPYINVESAAGGLAAGQTAEVSLRFSNEYLIPLGKCSCDNNAEEFCAANYPCAGGGSCVCMPTPKVFAGPGAR
jgi:hypothetical protein